MAPAGNESSPARRREFLPRDVVEARVSLGLVHAACRRRRTPFVTTLAPRFQRPPSAESLHLPRRRRRAGRPIRIRAAQRPRRRTGSALALAPARRELTA